MKDRVAMIAQAEAALRSCWAVGCAPSAEAVATIREALAIYDRRCLCWQQFLDEAMEAIGVRIDWRPGGIVNSFSYHGAVRPWGEHVLEAVWPAPSFEAVAAA